MATLTAESSVSGSPKTHRRRRAFGAILITLLAIILAAALVASGLVTWSVYRSFPQTSGSIAVAELNDEVRVLRDESGIPSIIANDAHDLFLAQGYVHAQDRFWEMDFRRHVTSGRLSELFGESQVGTDSFIRTLGWREVAEQEVADMDRTALGYYQAYAEGVNAYLAERSGAELSLEYAVLGLQNPDYRPEPWAPADSVAWMKAMAWDLRSNLSEEIDRALLSATLNPAELAELYPEYPYQEHPVIVVEDGKSAILGGDTAGAQDAENGSAATAATPRADSNDTTESNTMRPDAGHASTASALRELDARLATLPELIGANEGSGIGSNSWVVSGEHTATGKPLLANDPHLGPTLPSIWHQIGLRCETVSPRCPFDVAGYSFSGLPGVIIGHNADIAWGFTNLGPDVADLYLEQVDGDQYLVDGQWHPLEVREETITVAGGEPVPLTIRSTRHGPLVTDIGGDFASIAENPSPSTLQEASTPGNVEGGAAEYQVSLQWTALTPGPTAEAVFAMNAADDWESFREAAELFRVPSQNLVYADTLGNIGYQAPGLIPIRDRGDGTFPAPGWDSRFGWTGYLNFDDLPSILNPEEGFIVTANNAVTGPDYPHLISKDWDYGYRAAQIRNRLESLVNRGEVTTKELRDIQRDVHSPLAEVLVPVLTSGIPVTAETALSLQLLEDWNYDLAADSPAAAWFQVFWKNLLHEMFTEKYNSLEPDGGDRWFLIVTQLLQQPDSPWWQNARLQVDGMNAMLAHAAEMAQAEIVALQGERSENWSWGELHALPLQHATFGSSGIAPIEWLFNRGPYPVGGGSSIVNANGWTASEGYITNWVPSMRMVVDLSDFDASCWVNLTGNSGHAFHPNYTDQTELWQHGLSRPWPFSTEAVTEAADDTLTLMP